MLKTIVNTNSLPDFRLLDEMFDRMMGSPHRVGAANGNGVLPIDVYEQNNTLFVKAAIPGVDPEHLDLQIENNVLTIRGETKNHHESEEAKVYRREYSYGSFSRSIRLPEHLNLEKVSADFDNGFVTISLPRMAEEKPKSLRIPVKSPKAIDPKPVNGKSAK